MAAVEPTDGPESGRRDDDAHVASGITFRVCPI
jgi:hypothetical protein